MLPPHSALPCELQKLFEHQRLKHDEVVAPLTRRPQRQSEAIERTIETVTEIGLSGRDVVDVWHLRSPSSENPKSRAEHDQRQHCGGSQRVAEQLLS
jgi:hypothetical protein